VALTLLALAKVEDNSVIGKRYVQHNAWYFVADHSIGIRLIAMFFGPHTPEAQT
jgi:hypothetical protein